MPRRSFRTLSLMLSLGLGFGCAAGREPHSPAVFLQSYVWHEPDKAFGGFSGLELDARGSDFVALSDRATIWRGQILRDQSERITAIATSGPVRLHDAKGRRMTDMIGDSEGLALMPRGQVAISFEGRARVDRYPEDGGPAVPLPRSAVFKSYRGNEAFEALAVGADGALYTMPEGDKGHTGRTPIWRFRNGAWTQPFSISRDHGWKPVGADFGPDGRFYLLERDFRGLFGFAARVRVFDIEGDRISGGEVLLETRSGRHDNLEGIAVWRDGTDAIRLTMIADDNFNPFERTEIVEYRLDP